MNYFIEIELLSECILGSGESVPGVVDLEVLHDELGLPFYNAKTLKGKLRENAECLVNLLEKEFHNKEFENLFGFSNKNEMNKVTFSNAMVEEKIRECLKSEIENRNITKDEVFRALTDIRYFTSVNDNGVAEDGSLRQMRVINRGIQLISKVDVIEELNEKEEELLALSVSALKHIGLMSSRGKGQVNCSLYKAEENISKKYIEELKRSIV